MSIPLAASDIYPIVYTALSRFGWKTEVEYEEFPLGLSEDIVRAISAKKEEPDWLLDFRLRAYRRWLTMEEPDWSDNRFDASGSPLSLHLPTPNHLLTHFLLSCMPTHLSCSQSSATGTADLQSSSAE